jgi:KOW motif.
MNTQLPIGSRVRVISGRYAGKTGLLLRFEGDRAWVRSDAYATEVTFNVDELALVSDHRSETSDQRSETEPLLSDHRSETSDHHSETEPLLSDHRSETSDHHSETEPLLSDHRSETSDHHSETDLHTHIHEAIALLHALGTADGWLDSDRKPTSKTYPRYRWREDGAVRSRALAEWEVQPMRDRLRRGRLLRALLEYLG